ncbi:MAG: MarR family transcriptional regulator [Armatimonadetes bacterium]|nr:MarR family transcriptional regulator [Armatimonadota bacterium]
MEAAGIGPQTTGSPIMIHEEIPRPAGFTTWLQVVRCYQKASRRLSLRLRPLDITLAQLDVLANLHARGGGGVTQQELAQRLLVTKGNVSGLLDRMVVRGLVERRTDPSDRRSNQIFLTPGGKRLAARAVAIQREFVKEMLETLTPDEQGVLAGMLERVEERLEGMENN